MCHRLSVVSLTALSLHRDILRVGVTLVGHQKKILNSVQSMRAQMNQITSVEVWPLMSRRGEHWTGPDPQPGLPVRLWPSTPIRPLSLDRLPMSSVNSLQPVLYAQSGQFAAVLSPQPPPPHMLSLSLVLSLRLCPDCVRSPTAACLCWVHSCSPSLCL